MRGAYCLGHRQKPHTREPIHTDIRRQAYTGTVGYTDRHRQIHADTIGHNQTVGAPCFSPKIDPGAQGDLWIHFWSPFRFLLAPFGSLLASFSSFLVPFSSLLAPFSLPLRSFWFPFHPFGLPFGCFWLTLGSRLLSFGAPSSPFCYFRLRAYKIMQKNLFYKASEAAKHPFFYFCSFRKPASVTKYCSVHFPHASADNRWNPQQLKPFSKATCRTLP